MSRALFTKDVIATKFGFKDGNVRLGLDSRPETIKAAAEASLKQQEIDNKNNNEKLSIQKDLQLAANNVNLKAKEIGIAGEKLKLEKEKLATQRYISDNEMNQSVINKN